VERSVFSLRVAISNFGPQTDSITPSRQAASSLASQKILRVLRNSVVHYPFHNSSPLSLSPVGSVQPKTPTPVTGTNILILSSHLHLGLPRVSFQQTSPSNRCIHLSLPLTCHIFHYPDISLWFSSALPNGCPKVPQIRPQPLPLHFQHIIH
jgi:hypothetical protein